MKDPANDPLRSLLREWDVTAEAQDAEHPRFEEEVWRRIAAEESAANAGGAGGNWLARALEMLRSRSLNPVWGLAVVMIGLTIGAGFGQRAADHAQDREWSQLGQRYANSINPMVLAGTGHRHDKLTLEGGDERAR